MRKLKTKVKKTVKGLTLLECIIAILVLAIMGVVVCRVAQISCSIMINTNHLENKTNAEAPYGAVRDVQIESLPGFDPSDTSQKKNVTIKVGTSADDDVYGVVQATEYSAKVAADNAPNDTTANSNAHLRYYVLVEPTEATT